MTKFQLFMLSACATFVWSEPKTQTATIQDENACKSMLNDAAKGVKAVNKAIAEVRANCLGKKINIEKCNTAVNNLSSAGSSVYLGEGLSVCGANPG